jgi:hypothetical protein
MKTDLKSLRAKGVGQLLFESATHFALYVLNYGTYTTEVRTKAMPYEVRTVVVARNRHVLETSLRTTLESLLGSFLQHIPLHCRCEPLALYWVIDYVDKFAPC